MQIKEVSRRTGLTIKTIRFYEERGLIAPQQERKNGKSFRNYGEADVAQLQVVAVLRKCLFSIDQIKTMLDHPELTPEVFMEYRDALLSHRDLLELLAEKAETVDPNTLRDPETLARRLTVTAKPLPLPQMDVKPNFGRFDPETPEQRQAAFLKWQRNYRYRHVRKLIPWVGVALGLVLVTLIYGAVLEQRSIQQFFRVQDRIPSGSYAEILQGGETRGTYDGDILEHITYGIYDGTGERLSANGGPYAAEVFAGTMERLFALQSMGVWDEELQSAMSDWVAEHGLEKQTDVRSNLLHQTAAACMPVTVVGDSCTMVLFLELSPLRLAMEKLLLLYLCTAFVCCVVAAMRATQGYGFEVRFLRSYGLRDTWTDAIISVDEDHGSATMLTHQYTGMNNLVHMDYDRKQSTE